MTMPHLPKEPICAHCSRPMRGYGGRWRGGVRQYLCHPDDGPDCYHYVTVYGHPTPCPACPGRVGMRTIEQALE